MPSYSLTHELASTRNANNIIVIFCLMAPELMRWSCRYFGIENAKIPNRMTGYFVRFNERCLQIVLLLIPCQRLALPIGLQNGVIIGYVTNVRRPLSADDGCSKNQLELQLQASRVLNLSCSFSYGKYYAIHSVRKNCTLWRWKCDCK